MATPDCSARIQSIIDALAATPGAVVTFTVESLRHLVHGEPKVKEEPADNGGASPLGIKDLTLREAKKHTDLSVSRLRELCAEKDAATGLSPHFPNSYKGRGRGWKIPPADVAEFMKRERENGLAQRSHAAGTAASPSAEQAGQQLARRDGAKTAFRPKVGSARGQGRRKAGPVQTPRASSPLDAWREVT